MVIGKDDLNFYFYAFKGKSLLSRAIRYWTRGVYSHIAIHDPANSDNPLIEAWKFGREVRWGFSSLANHTPGTLYELWRLPSKGRAEYDFCLNFWRMLAHNNAPYDFGAIFAFIKRGSYTNNDRFFCSEGAIYPIFAWRNWNRI